MTRLAIVGGGSWGTALAVVLAPRFPEIRLWVFERDLAVRMSDTRENDVYLPGFRIPANVRVTTEFAEALDGAGIVLGVTPSHVTRAIFERMLPYLDPSMLFVSATKGLGPVAPADGSSQTLVRMSEVIRSVVATRFEPRIAVLSGPTFAREVAAGEPAAVVISSTDPALNELVQRAFSGPTFRLYTNTDPVGVEVGAALKNVIAIGAGVTSGLGLGNNTIAALVTRGLAEIARLAVAVGGEPRTLAGLAGLGDLVLTSTGALSRNRQVGIELGRGRRLEEIIGSMRMVAEGVQTTYAAVELARGCAIEMPITGQVNAILRGLRSPREAIRELMERSLKGE